MTPKDFAYDVHMCHCFIGHYRYGCKYGESDICPANPGAEELERRYNNELRNHLKPVFINIYTENYLGIATRTIDENEFVFVDPLIEEKFCVFVEGYKCYTKFPQNDDNY